MGCLGFSPDESLLIHAITEEGRLLAHEHNIECSRPMQQWVCLKDDDAPCEAYQKAHWSCLLLRLCIHFLSLFSHKSWGLVPHGSASSGLRLTSWILNTMAFGNGPVLELGPWVRATFLLLILCLSITFDQSNVM